MTSKPLDGLRVLDLTQFYQGPYAAFLMAMAGADVIKVEPIGGERTRRGGGTDTPLAFAMLNSNKKSLTLDLKGERGRSLFLDLADKADVVIENFAPGGMDRLGLGWETLRARNPRLIYGTATGYGISGPGRDQLAMDHTIQAACGIMGLTGEADGPPARAAGAARGRDRGCAAAMARRVDIRDHLQSRRPSRARCMSPRAPGPRQSEEREVD